MRIAALNKNSFIDYPEKISCVVFLSGCNFKCPYCHNPELANGKSLLALSEDLLFDFLESRKGFLDGVVISGGEPTLQKGLIYLCEKIKDIGYPVKLDTNGSRPEVIKKLIDKGLVDYIAMDIKTDMSNYSYLIKDRTISNNIALSMQIIKDSSIDYEFRSTCVKQLFNKNTIKNMKYLIKGAKLYMLQRFNSTNVLQPDFFTDSETYRDNELLEMKLILDKIVNKCKIRQGDTMPILEFECKKCGEIKEKLILNKYEDTEMVCVCGEDMNRIMSVNNFYLVGDGWAKDCYCKNKA